MRFLVRFAQWFFCKIDQPIWSPSLSGKCVYCNKQTVSVKEKNGTVVRHEKEQK